MTLRPLLCIVRKDLKLFLSDRRAVILSFAVPLALASFFAVVFGGGAGGSSGEAARISIGVSSLDPGAVSTAIVAAVTADPALQVEAIDPESARQAVRKGQSVVAVVIPEGFGPAATRALFPPGKKPELLILYDPTHRAEAAMVRGILTQHVIKVVTSNAFDPDNLRDRIGEVDGSDMSPGDKLALKVLLRGVVAWNDRWPATSGAESLSGFSMPFEAREDAVTAGDQNARVAANAHAFGGMAVQFILFSSIETGIALLTERQKGLWRRLRSAPVSRPVLLIGRGVSATIIALMILGVIFGFGAVVFGIRVQGSVVAFLLVSLTYATTAGSFGLVIASLGKTPQAARGLAAMAVLMMVMLGGAWVPTFAFPAWLQKVTPLIPTRWAVDGFDATLARGYSLMEALPTIGVLAGFTAAFGLLAFARFRWEE